MSSPAATAEFGTYAREVVSRKENEYRRGLIRELGLIAGTIFLTIIGGVVDCYGLPEYPAYETYAAFCFSKSIANPRLL
jgi:hypothetical protein